VIKVLDPDTGRERLSLAGHRNMIWKLGFSPDGRRLASLGSYPMQAPEIKLWDMAGGREILNLKATGVDLIGSNDLGSGGFGFSPDGQRLIYVPGGSRRDAEVQGWDATPLPENRVDPLAVP
jgi:WD40 repeat protein